MRNRPALRRPSAVRTLACVFLALLAGCASASKRYEQGVELEQRGRAVDAARRYVEALRKEPGLAEARQRLGETGARAVDDLLREAVALDAAGRPDEGAEALLRLDALRRDAAAVGVQLAAPGDYAARRRFVFDRAIEAAVAGAESPGTRGWADALRRLERAGTGLEPSAAQRERLDRARSGVFLAWGESEASRGRFREAYDVADRGLRALGRDSPEAGRLADFRADVLRRGTVRVAVLPLAAEDERRRRLDEELLPEVDDVLAERHWPAAPPFVEVVDPQRVAREARREGYGRRAATAREAARLARALGADYAIVAEVDSVRVDERDVREARRAVKTREGADTVHAAGGAPGGLGAGGALPGGRAGRAGAGPRHRRRQPLRALPPRRLPRRRAHARHPPRRPGPVRAAGRDAGPARAGAGPGRRPGGAHGPRGVRRRVAAGAVATSTPGPDTQDRSRVGRTGSQGTVGTGATVGPDGGPLRRGGDVAASSSSCDGSSALVTTCGHRMQAARPSCLHQRQSERIVHAGRSTVTTGRSRAARSTSRHRVFSKCSHRLHMHGAANRNTSVGFTGPASRSSSSVTTCGLERAVTRGSEGVPPTTANTMLPGMSGCALGHSGLDLAAPLRLTWSASPPFPAPASGTVPRSEAPGRAGVS